MLRRISGLIMAYYKTSKGNYFRTGEILKVLIGKLEQPIFFPPFALSGSIWNKKNQLKNLQYSTDHMLFKFLIQKKTSRLSLTQ
jgi:hypothetical protein